MKTKINFDYPKISFQENKNFNVRLVLGLKGEDGFKPVRMPLNIALVLDHSGSMSGTKLDNVKTAAINLFNRLQPDDIFSLVIFENQVTPLIQPAKKSELRNVESIINNIHSAGMTFLSGGYEYGFNNCSKYKSSESISRIILLSDGLVNVGIRNKNELGSIAAEYFEQGISTSTVGVGYDYDEDLMVLLAERGSGNSYYIEDPADIENVFYEELSYLTDLYAVNTKLIIKSKIEGLELGQLTNFKVINSNEFEIGDIFCDKTVNAIFEFGIPPQNKFERLNFADIEIIYDDLSDLKKSRKSKTISLNIEIVDLNEFQLQKPDENVLKDIAYILLAKAKRDARLEAIAGRYEESSIVLNKILAVITAFNLKDENIISEINKVKESSNNIRINKERYFDKRQSKRYAYEYENISKGKMFAFERHNQRINKNENIARSDNYLFIDINATGRYRRSLPIIPRLVQLGWIITDTNYNIKKSANHIVKPEDFKIPKEAAMFHGITTEIAERKGLPLEIVMEEFYNSIHPIFDNITLIAYDDNIVADVLANESRLLRRRSSGHGFIIPFDQINHIALRKIASNIISPPYKKHSHYPLLSEIYEYFFHKPIMTNNDAYEDANVILECYKALSKIYY